MNQTRRYARVGSPVQDGVATVVRALDPVTGLPVRVYRFDADPAPGAATLRHPSVVRVLAAGSDDDGGFVVSDVIDGAADLHARPGALDVATAADALRALAAVHEHGVVHGDATARRVLRRGADVWLEGVGVPWGPASPDDDVRQLANSLLEVRGHALPAAVVEHLRAACARETVDAATLADELERLASAPTGVANDAEAAAVDARPVDDADDADDVDDVDDLDDIDDADADGDVAAEALDEPATEAQPREADATVDQGREPDEAPEPAPPTRSHDAPEASDTPAPTVVRRRVATDDMAPEPAPPPGPVVSRRIAGEPPASRTETPAPRPAVPARPSPSTRPEPPAPASPAPGSAARPAAPTPAAASGSFSKTPPPDVRYRVGEMPLDERPSGSGRAAGPAAAQRQRRRTWMLAALLIGALVLAIVTAVGRRPVPPPASGTVTSIVVDVRLDPATLPPATLVVVASPSGSRRSAGSSLGTVPSRVVFDAEGSWQVEARFQDRRSEIVTFRLPDEREIVLRFPALP